ncbi:MAG TPA: archease [Longimicrobiales bacterium]|nr:archease [Longimicrobiales bacterium]
MVQPEIQFLAHTADVGLLLRADTLPQLFRIAADGLFQLTRNEDVEHVHTNAAETRALELHADDVALLLVAWLRELLYVQQAEQLCITGLDLHSLTERDLVATIHCTACTAPQREIKAVTYHQLSVSRQQGVWTGRVIFDV